MIPTQPSLTALPPMERGTIYTLGYTQNEAGDHLDRLMQDLHTVLVDIRFSPRSQWAPRWNRAALTARYGRRYLWDRRLGNVRYQERTGQDIQLAGGHEEAIQEAAVLVREGISLVLLCACKNARTCHRSLVAKLIQDALPMPEYGGAST